MARQRDLIDQVNLNLVECLNENPEHTVSNVLKPGYRDDDGLFLQSDTDEQLLCHISFQTAVTLQSISFRSVQEKDCAPKRIRLFINRPTLGFGDAAELAPAQEFELNDALLEGEAIALKVVKFQRVTTLSIFVASNQGEAETTIIQKIILTGASGDSFNVKDIKKAGGDES